MKKALLTLLAIATTILFSQTAPLAALTTSDQSCMTSPGVWSGALCAVDQNGNNITDNCTELQICYRPTGGICTQNPTPTGFECILPNGTKVPCGADTCTVGYPACEVQGGVQSPIYNYTCGNAGGPPPDQFYEDQAIIGVQINPTATFSTTTAGNKMTIFNFTTTASFTLTDFAATQNQSCTIQGTQDTTITGSGSDLVFQGGCTLNFTGVTFTGTTTYLAQKPALPPGTNGQCDWYPMISILWRTKIVASWDLSPVVPGNTACDGRKIPNGEITTAPAGGGGGTYSTIEQCQASCGASCDCPQPGIWNQSAGKCTVEPTIECTSPYTYDTQYMECTSKRLCPNDTVWMQDYGKCIGEPIIVCPDPFLATDFNPLTQKCEQPPQCPLPNTFDPTFMGVGKCTVIGNVDCGPYAFDPQLGLCDAGPATCSSGGIIDPTDQRCEVAAPAPSCDTAAGYSYNSTVGKCVKQPPACAAGSWNYANDRCESTSTTNYHCNYNGQTYPDNATCQANCRQYANCAVGSVSGSGQYGWLYPGSPNYYEIAIRNGGTQFSIGNVVVGLVGFSGTDNICTVDNMGAGVVIQVVNGGTALRINGSCDLQFSGVLLSGIINYQPYEWDRLYLRLGYPNAGSLIYGFAENYSVNQPYVIGIGGCPLTGGTACTGTPPTCYVQQGCQSVAGCPNGWTPFGGPPATGCYGPGTCSGATMQLNYGGNTNNDYCTTNATTNCPFGSYDPNHNTAMFPGPVCYHSTDCPPGFPPQNGECLGAGAGTCPPSYPNKDTTTGKCWVDPTCNAGTYSIDTKTCAADASVTCPPETQYSSQYNKCTADGGCPAPGTYDPLIDKCFYVGTPSCQPPYTYDAANQRCVYTPPCTPSDWICPTDAADPLCNSTLPVTKKTYIEIGDGTTDASGHYTPPPTYTFALPTTPTTYDTYVTLATSYGAHTADTTYKDQIIAAYGNGPLWIQGGVLYNDVYLNISNCYTYTDYSTPTPRLWRPKDYTTASCTNVATSWERYETGCLCTKFKESTITRACDPNPPYYTETTTDTFTDVDTSNCTGTPIDTCKNGTTQPGLNQCSANIPNSGPDLICPIDPTTNITIKQTDTIKTCETQVSPVAFIMEYRNIPPTNYGVFQWDKAQCNPCQQPTAVEQIPEPPKEPEPPPFDPTTCTNFRVFSGTDRRCHKSGMETIFTDCCDLDGWFPTWCDNEEKELKKRRLAGTCHEVGEYCSKRIKFLFVKMCVQKKMTYCCFNSKLARILQEQIRPQLSKDFGSPEKPDCKGFTPEEFAQTDFSRVDLSEYVNDIQGQAQNSINSGATKSAIEKGVNEWIQQQTTTPGNPAPATRTDY